MEENKTKVPENNNARISDAVLIEIVHSLKDIFIELIDHAFPMKAS